MAWLIKSQGIRVPQNLRWLGRVTETAAEAAFADFPSCGVGGGGSRPEKSKEMGAAGGHGEGRRDVLRAPNTFLEAQVLSLGWPG